jgi:hypothetical protein
MLLSCPAGSLESHAKEIKWQPRQELLKEHVVFQADLVRGRVGNENP